MTETHPGEAVMKEEKFPHNRGAFHMQGLWRDLESQRQYNWKQKQKQKKQTQNMHLASTTKWWTGRSGVLRFMRLQRVRHDWATELNWTSGEVAQRLMSTSSEWEFDVEEWDASSILRVSTGFKCPEDNLKDLIWDSYPNHGIARERKKKAPFP